MARFIILILLGTCLLACAQTSFTYTLEPVSYRGEGDKIFVYFNVRKNGEGYTVSQYIIPRSSRWRKIFEEGWHKFDKEEIFYEIIMDKELDRSRMFVPSLGMVTKQVQADVANLPQNQGDTFAGIQDSSVLSVKQITENEHLGIKPRIIKTTDEK